MWAWFFARALRLPASFRKSTAVQGAMACILSASFLPLSSWSMLMGELPEADFYSANQQWRFHVKPGVWPGCPRPVALRRSRGEDTGPEGPLFYLYAEGELSKRNGQAWSVVWKRRLHNPSAPMRALIAGHGSFVVTLGDVQDMLRPHSVNDVVVYGPAGGLLDRIELRKVASLDRLQQYARGWRAQAWTEALPYPTARWAVLATLDESQRKIVVPPLEGGPGSPLLIPFGQGPETPYKPYRAVLVPDDALPEEELYAEVKRSRNLAEQPQNILRLLRSEDVEWRKEALSFLQRIYIPEATPELVLAYADFDTNAAQLAGYAIKRLPPSERDKVFLSLFQYPYPNIRARAVMDTRGQPTSGILAGLTQLARDTNAEVRAAVARRGLPDWPGLDRRFVRGFFRNLQHDSHGNVRLFADSAMLAIDQATIEPLLKKLQQPGASQDRMTRGVLKNLRNELQVDAETAADFLDRHEKLIIGFLKGPEFDMISYEAVEVLALHPSRASLAAISDVAKNHPSVHVRNIAQITIDRSEKANPK